MPLPAASPIDAFDEAEDIRGAKLFNKLDPWVESLNKKGLTKKD
ncbi:hypothetical protein [Pseudomonas aeruginosa]|nr:hypothetical protein [Pseudomonas aeruginosa]